MELTSLGRRGFRIKRQIMKCNSMMRGLLTSGGSISPAESAAAEKRIEKLFKDMVFENGCLFLSTYCGKANAKNVSDRVEFETRYNEILINSEFPKRKITPVFAMRFFVRFNARLQRERGGKICAVMSEDGGRWTYRFHMLREGDKPWISEDLERFAQPIMYDIFEGNNDEL